MARPRHAKPDSSSAESRSSRLRRDPRAGRAGHRRTARQRSAWRASDIDRAVEAARTALNGDWGKTAATERSRLLHALADAIAANRAELVELEARNVGKASSSVKAELFGAAENFRFYASAVATIAGRSNPIGGSLLFYSLKEPVGVAAQIVPWNYPLLLATWKLAPALAAGCSVVLKPDPQTPLTALRLAELAAEVGFPAGAINVVPADGPTVGAYLVRHPGVDKVAFTGSTKTGAEIMRLAADPLTRVTLELGGKCPNLVFADADLAGAIPSSVWSIFYAPARAARPARGSWWRSRCTTSSSPSSSRRPGAEGRRPSRSGDADGVADLAGASRPGTRVRRAGTRGGRRGRARRRDRRGERRVLPADRIAGVDSAMAVAQEEIFGPVVTVIPFEDEAEAIRIANDVRYGLMATVWTGDPGRGHRIAAKIKSGTVGINMPYTAFPGIPFGGYKQSGFGRELGVDALELYLETKSVIVNTARSRSTRSASSKATRRSPLGEAPAYGLLHRAGQTAARAGGARPAALRPRRTRRR